MAMAKVDSGSTSSPIHSNSSHDVKDSHVNISYGDDSNIPVKKRKNHDKLVQEIRISVGFLEAYFIFWLLEFVNKCINWYLFIFSLCLRK